MSSTLYRWQSYNAYTKHTFCKHHFILESVLSTLYWGIWNSIETYCQCTKDPSFFNPDESIAQVWERKFNFIRLQSTINFYNTPTPTATIPFASRSQHIHPRRYTIHKSILISHISDDSDEEHNLNQKDIDAGNVCLLLLHPKSVNGFVL